MNRTVTSLAIVLVLLADAVPSEGAERGIPLPVEERPANPVGLSEDMTLEADSCEVLSYHGDAYLYFRLPHSCPPDECYAQLFKPHGLCSLTLVSLALYRSYPEFSDQSGLGIDIIIYEEGGWIGPGPEVARINVPATQLQYFPLWTDVDFSPLGLDFDTNFYVGFTVVDQEVDNFAILGDDGQSGNYRSFHFCDFFWSSLAFGNQDPDFLIDVRVCFPSDYTCGDADGNDLVNISDAVYLVDYIFGGGPPPDPLAAGDVNCDGIVNVSDAVYLMAYIFGGGSEPCDTDDDGEPDC